MTDNITRFPGLALPGDHQEVDPDIIDRLEGLLEDARAGRILILAYAAVAQHEMIKTSWVGQHSRGLTGYAIAKLHAEFYKACLDDD